MHTKIIDAGVFVFRSRCTYIFAKPPPPQSRKTRLQCLCVCALGEGGSVVVRKNADFKSHGAGEEEHSVARKVVRSEDREIRERQSAKAHARENPYNVLLCVAVCCSVLQCARLGTHCNTLKHTERKRKTWLLEAIIPPPLDSRLTPESAMGVGGEAPDCVFQ